MLKCRSFGVFLGMLGLFGILTGCAAESKNDDMSESNEAVVSGSDQLQEVDNSSLVTRKAFANDDGTERVVTSSDDFAPTASASFWNSCHPYKEVTFRRSDGAVVSAYADWCAKPNGDLVGPRSWRGVCKSDLANCNGTLKCGRC